MPRDVDDKKTRKALRKLRKAKARAEAEGVDLTDWEKEFVEGVDERLNKYGSAFADPSLGTRDEALSNAQTEILRQLDRKSRGKGNGGFKTRKPLKPKKGMSTYAPRTRQLDDDADSADDDERSNATPPFDAPEDKTGPRLVSSHSSDTPDPAPESIRKPSPGNPAFRVIQGGQSDKG